MAVLDLLAGIRLPPVSEDAQNLQEFVIKAQQVILVFVPKEAAAALVFVLQELVCSAVF